MIYSKINYKKIIIYLLLLYIDIRYLFKYLFGNVPADLYGIFIILVTVMFALDNFVKRYKNTRDYYFLMFLLISYYVYIITNGIMFNNLGRLAVALDEYIIYSLPVFFSMYLLRRRKQRLRMEEIMKYMLIVGMIIAILAVFEYFTGRNLLPSDQVAYIGIGNRFIRAQVFSGSYLALAPLLSCLALLNFYYLCEPNIKTTKKIKYIICFIIYIIGILCTGSRGPLVGLLISSILFLLIYSININNKFRFLKRMCIILITVIGIVCMFQFVNYTPSSDNYILNSFIIRVQSIFNWNTDPSNVQRVSLWKYSYNMFKENMWCGIGVSSTGGGHIGTTSIGVTESGILKRFVELGIFGASIYYIFIFIVIRKAIKYIKGRKIDYHDKLLVLTMLCSVLAIFIDDITYQVSEHLQVMFYFWFFIGVIIVYTMKLDKTKGER